ncbi:hypothetical protein SISNIDRAFT_455053 [Sistotremastrum niveocremeum HHB9708]|uniref:Peroxisomal membrane protein PEX14 n=1 Tax=Sistotremastrum niveocremeum HHB9708 TaxID=1314777 RepID=A0A164UBN8_9AGAM|nr:hypothetical protein SISNIDRAFT_455053 [Sistotremastrum niveocremeum HHB9708]
MSDRAELLRNAVSFLADPKTSDAPFGQRIQFLESKGLTPAEIEHALLEAAVNKGHTSSTPIQSVSSHAPYQQSLYGLTAPPAPRQLDWRDYFIMAVVSGGVMFGIASLARKYVLPHLKPPSITQYEADAEALDAKFQEIETLVQEVHRETEVARELIASQTAKVDGLVDEVESTVKELKESDVKNRDDLREIREEINVIREMLPKMIEKNKELTNASLGEIREELGKLGTLLKSTTTRPALGSPGALFSSTSTPQIPTKPSLPAWQLSTPATPPASTPDAST